MTAPNHQQKNELEHILASGIFAKAPRQGKLLKYICEEYFQGRTGQIKEYTLATEVLGRSADFDPNRDAIVRVEIHRLRKKLKEYYEGEGVTRQLEIVIDCGQYVPRFVPRGKTPLIEAEANLGNSRSPADRSLESPTAAEPAPPSIWPGIRPWQVSAGILLLAAVAIGLILKFGARFATPVKASPASAAVIPVASTGTPGPLESVRILCGYSRDKYIDRGGNVWMGDRYYSGGDSTTQTLQFLPRAPDVAMFQTFRFGDFSYDIPLRPGNYELHLYFLETHYGPGSLSGGGETSRMFDVMLNGQPLLKLFDIIKDAGGNDIADERVFKDVAPAPDNQLHLKFKRLLDSPLLNAIAILPTPAGKIYPIRILAQNNSYTDRKGSIWSPDRYFRGGQLALHLSRAPVSGTPDPGIYTSERYGNFSYAIPVPPGKYQVTLRLAETYWGLQNTYPNLPDQSGSPVGGVQSRVFDVYCNGTTLLKNFDISKEAGGPLRAADKTFHNLQPDAQGKLILSFVPVRDYAVVNAIEVQSEAQ